MVSICKCVLSFTLILLPVQNLVEGPGLIGLNNVSENTLYESEQDVLSLINTVKIYIFILKFSLLKYIFLADKPVNYSRCMHAMS